MALAAVTLAGTLLACGMIGGDTATPEGAVVRIHVEGDRVVLDPPSVPAGTVHLESSTPGVAMISASSGGNESAMEPLDEEALSRIERGDFQDTLTSGTEGAFGGPRYTVILPPGRYAFAILATEDDQQDGAPVAMSVLTVEAPSLPSVAPATTTPD